MALEKYMKQVTGKKKGDVLLYALSTCGWCRKTKDLLGDLGVEYRYIDVDLLGSEAKSEAIKEITGWNPTGRACRTMNSPSTGSLRESQDEPGSPSL